MIVRDAGVRQPAADSPGDGIGVVIIASYPSVRAGLTALLAHTEGLTVLTDAVDAEVDAPEVPDVLLIDVDASRPNIPARLADRYPDVAQVLLLEAPADARHIMATVEQVRAILLKEAGADEIAAAIRAAITGLIVLDPTVANASLERHPSSSASADLIEPLTDREREVLELLALGLPNKTIAGELGISEHTAKFHVGSIMSKLGAASRTEAVALAARRGVLVL